VSRDVPGCLKKLLEVPSEAALVSRGVSPCLVTTTRLVAPGLPPSVQARQGDSRAPLVIGELIRNQQLAGSIPAGGLGFFCRMCQACAIGLEAVAIEQTALKSAFRWSSLPRAPERGRNGARETRDHLLALNLSRAPLS